MKTAEMGLCALATDVSAKARWKAVQALRRFVDRGGDGPGLVECLERLQPGVTPGYARYGGERIPLSKAWDRIYRRRTRAVVSLERGAEALLELYDAPRESLEWRAVYLAAYPSEEAARISGGKRAREEFRDQLRVVLKFIRKDYALKTRPGGPPRHKHASRRGPERILRQRFGLSRDDARALLAALK